MQKALKMTLEINKNTTIADVQYQFSKIYPYLKIEFFTRPHEVGSASWSKYMIFNRTKTIGEIGILPTKENSFEVDSAMSVNDFEQGLQRQYGLSVQVFRKSMGSWIATTESDTWTLAVQNEKGGQSATTINEMIFVARDNQED
jgi:hypothetical protein